MYLLIILLSLPKSDSSPQATQMTKHIPIDPVFLNTVSTDTKIPDPIK